MAAALFMMGIILLWQFNSFYGIFVTLSAVILSTAGVLVGINLFMPYISILMVGTGVIALAGVVVGHNILFIDTFNRLRSDGRPLEEAAIATAAQRVRPILLTTATTILGLIPMMLQMNIDFAEGAIDFGGASSEWWVQLATAVVCGLTFSTILICLVTPAWLLVPYRVSSWSARQWERFSPPLMARLEPILARNRGRKAEPDSSPSQPPPARAPKADNDEVLPAAE
jgi:multidrug efflux pump